jgi:hypothetical protein
MQHLSDEGRGNLKRRMAISHLELPAEQHDGDVAVRAQFL